MARSVLLVDDDPSVLRVLRRYFERSGWETFQALSGEDGVRTFEAQLPDLVLLDVNLPGISGLHVLEVLISRGATVVMLTGQAEVGTAVEAMRGGAGGAAAAPRAPAPARPRATSRAAAGW